MLELTPEEIKNGWTVESLEAYIEGRERVQAGVVMFDHEHRQQQKPRWANSLYNPLRLR